MKQNAIKRRAIAILISFLVLVLLFVGVSTATYAWYSAINRALGDSITFTSSAYDQLGGDLTIGWAKDSILNELTFDTPNSNLYPMIPKTEPVIGTTTYYQFVSNNFNYSGQRFNGDLQTWICSFGGQNTTPYTCIGSETTPDAAIYNYFYLTNRKTTEKQTITAKYVISGDLSEELRVAIFIGDPVDTNTDVENLASMRFMGILANNDTIYYDTISENDVVMDTPIMDNVYRTSSSISFLIDENSSKCCTLVAWLDGVLINNEDVLKTTSFNIVFDGIAGDLT